MDIFKKSKHIRKVVRDLQRRELELINQHYDCFDCKIEKNELICKMKVKPTDNSSIYHMDLRYSVFNVPKVYCRKPEITFSDEIHVWRDDVSLCLYYPKDLEWNPFKHHLYNTIIPWSIEWFLFYEKYKYSGKWEHPEVKHTIIPKLRANHEDPVEVQL